MGKSKDNYVNKIYFKSYRGKLMRISAEKWSFVHPIVISINNWWWLRSMSAGGVGSFRLE